MFELGNFIEDCATAVREDPSHKGVADLMARAASNPDAMLREIGEPTEGGVFPVYRSPELTVINVV
ncbi:MAG: hypothetical protein AAF293_15790 [Pseudomonadota bacterium]